MNRKGFTLLELMIFIGILAIFAALILPNLVSGMEVQKLMPSDNETISNVARVLKNDPYQTVTIVVYGEEWTFDNTDEFVKASEDITKKFKATGIREDRINLLFANKAGLVEDSTPIPTKDGVYLWLD